MKNLLLSASLLLMLASCGVNTKNTASNADTLSQTQEKGLVTTMSIPATIKAGDSLLLKFIVRNNADTAMQFCKWHTPFEPLMSKYLDIKDQEGVEADYKGAMAKRMMPPPAESYITLNPKDSLVATIDLLKGYTITKPSTYTITYSGQNMSGLMVKDSVSFTYLN